MAESVRVLCVEDDPEFADLTATGLEKEDSTLPVVTETRPENAVTRFRDGSIDCIVSDYDVPTIDGVELLAEVRAEDPELRLFGSPAKDPKRSRPRRSRRG